MIRIIHTDSFHPDFISLVRGLDAELAERDGDDNVFYSQYNGIASLNNVVLAFADGQAVGCGAIKDFGDTAMEVKRMFVLPEYRGRGIASIVLSELEQRAAELGYGKCVLETGLRQPEAISLYHKSGYKPITNYGPYKGVENSRCFEKVVGAARKPEARE